MAKPVEKVNNGVDPVAKPILAADSMPRFKPVKRFEDHHLPQSAVDKINELVDRVNELGKV